MVRAGRGVGGGRATAVFAMQSTASRINCCLYAPDAADACKLLTALQREGKIEWKRPVMFAATNSQKSSALALHSKYTRALTSETLCQGLADTLLPQVSNLALQAQAKTSQNVLCLVTSIVHIRGH